MSHLLGAYESRTIFLRMMTQMRVFQEAKQWIEGASETCGEL